MVKRRLCDCRLQLHAGVYDEVSFGKRPKFILVELSCTHARHRSTPASPPARTWLVRVEQIMIKKQHCILQVPCMTLYVFDLLHLSQH